MTARGRRHLPHPRALRVAIAALFALAAGLSGSLRADVPSSRAHKVELLVATGVGSTREDALVPIASTGPALELGLGYGARLGQNTFHASTRLGLGLLVDRHDGRVALMHHELALAFSRALALETDRHALAWGAVLRWTTDDALFEHWDDTHLYWLAGLTFGPSFAWTHALGERYHLDGYLDLALVALASRPPARRLTKQDAVNHPSYWFSRVGAEPRFTSVLDTQWARLHLVARRGSTRGDPGGWGLGLEVRFARASWPASFAALHTGLSLGRGWTW